MARVLCIIQYTMVTFCIHLPGFSGIIHNMQALIFSAMLQSSAEPWGNVTKALSRCLPACTSWQLWEQLFRQNNKTFIIHFVMLRLKKKAERESRRGEGKRQHKKIRCTCVTESDRPLSCGKIALIHFPHSKSSCLQYSCHLAQ